MDKKYKNGFEEKVIKKLDVIDKKFDVIDKKFDVIDKKVDAIDKKFDQKIDDLASMVSRGFEETASKSELGEVRTRLDRIDMRLDRIENILLRDHNNRIERLEDKLLQVEVILGKKLLK